ncbi:MAG: M42 family metallopeptidase [Eggerthellaceae bacterium]|jgi:endoglucanase|nr:M42 family metallopeptidase [Eggerthellaceae bacterium]
MDSKDEQFLKTILETPSVTGTESNVARLVRERLGNTADEVQTDVMGSVHARLSGTSQNAPSVMIAAHMDEIGLMVRYISDEGFISFTTVGGIDAGLMPGMRVDVHCEGKPLRGVIGRKPIHLVPADERKTVTPVNQLVVDLGMSADAVKSKVRIGDTMTFAVGFEPFGTHMAVSRGFDDKAGVFIAIRTMELIKEAGGAPGDYICAATVQEEIGLRGGITSAYGVNPDVGIAFDVTHATDYPHIDKEKFGSLACGSGPVIARGPNCNPVVTERLIASAEAEHIDYQLEAEPGVTGTDAGAIQVSRGGTACGLVSLPLRYMHTPTEVISLDDVDACAKLLSRFILDLDEDVSFVPGM